MCARVCIYIFFISMLVEVVRKEKNFIIGRRGPLSFFFLFYLQSIRSFRDPPFEKVKRKVSTDSKIGVSYLRRPYKVVDRFNFVFFGNHKASLLA